MRKLNKHLLILRSIVFIRQTIIMRRHHKKGAGWFFSWSEVWSGVWSGVWTGVWSEVWSEVWELSLLNELDSSGPFLDLKGIWCACNEKTVNSICSKCSLDVILKISESDMSQIWKILDLNTTQEVTQGHSLECHLGLWHHFLFKFYSFQKVSMAHRL